MSLLAMAMLLAGAAQVQGAGPAEPPRPAVPPVMLRWPQNCLPHADAEGKYDFTSCFNAGDYPVAAWEARAQGVARVRLTFGAGDRPTGCEILASSGSAALDQASCALLRERILAVSDAHWGAVHNAAITGDVAWVLPDSYPHDDRPSLLTYFSTDDYPAAALRGNEQGLTGAQLEIGANGRVTDCYPILSSGSAALDQATCRIIRSRVRYRPAQDAAGRPVPGRDFVSVAWRLPEE